MFELKRMLLPLLACLALLCLAGCGANTPTVSVKPQRSEFSSVPNGTGNQPEPGTDNKPSPTPEGHAESILVANGLVYVGSDNGKVYAFDALSGTIRWQSQEKATDLFAVDGNTLYTGDMNNNVFYALNAKDGSVLWQRAMQEEFSKVEVDNAIVYINTLGGTAPSSIYALQATTGTLLWRYTVASAGYSLLAVSNGRVYDAPTPTLDGAASAPRTFTVLDASSGHVLWQLTPSAGTGTIGGGIAESDGIVYLSSDSGSLYAVRESSGQVIWDVSQASSGTFRPLFAATTPVIMDGTVYTANAIAVFAYRASDGQQIWQYHPTVTNGMPSPFGIQPMVSNGSVYFSTSFTMGNLIALRASDGAVLWQKSGAEVAPAALTLVNGLLISQVGQITAWRTSDGGKVWSRNTDSNAGPPGPGSAVVTSSDTGTLYAGGGNGVFQALRVSDGTPIWTYALPEIPVPHRPVYNATITFTSSTSYDRAIQIVSDLGLKTFAACHAEWVSEDGKSYFASEHLFFVAATPNSAPLWLERLKAMPEVSQAQSNSNGPQSCTDDSIGPDSIQRLRSSQAGTYLNVRFTSATAYLAAWESLNALGFRLADPCYEKARAQDRKPTWQAMGQEGSFAQTHTLVLATTQFNAVTWHPQLQSAAGVQHIDPLSAPGCN